MSRIQAKRKVSVTRAAAAGLALAAAGAVAACGTSASSSAAAAASAAAVTEPMATSIAAGADSWAIVPMAANPVFWQVFSRTGNSADWKLVTPPGVAINAGIVASASGASSLTLAVLPSQNLTFSPLAATANGGASWTTPAPIGSAVAASPGALAADGSDLATLLSNGSIETSSDGGTSWSTIAKPGAIGTSPAAKGCGTVRVTSVSFGTSSTDLLAGGTCGTTAAVFSYSPASGWQRDSLPASGQLLRFTDGIALVQGKSGLSALWNGADSYAYAPLTATSSQPTSWTTSAPLQVSGTVTESGTLALGEAWVLLSGGRAATVSLTGPTAGGAQWRLLPNVPAGTSVLAAGPSGAVDALAVSGAKVTVWQLATNATAWSKVQAISVPIQYGSSS